MRYIFLALLIIAFNKPVFASDPFWTECDHIETVTGMDDWKPKISIGSLEDFDGKSYILIDGWLETPSPGYNYEIELENITNNIQNINLKLVTPSGSTLSVIDKISISERFAPTKKIEKIIINIEKDFNWGPKIINCKL